MMKILFFLLATSLLLFSCGNTSNKKPNKQIQTLTQKEHNHNNENEQIELNLGEKWKVDDHMITHIRNMENDVNSFVKVEKKDYKSLSKKLNSNIDSLSSNCTMKGKSHDELHKWLLPYIDIVKELSEAKDENEAEKQIQEIENSFITFNKYFQ